MRLLPIARHRPRHVHGVLRPRSWPWRFKMESCCHAFVSQKALGYLLWLSHPLEAISFSSARTSKRFPSSRCTLVTQIVFDISKNLQRDLGELISCQMLRSFSIAHILQQGRM
jgi:hypothetical protein